MKGLLSNLLVVVNGSESSIAAVKFAICLQRSLACKIAAAYVVDTATIRQLALSRIFVVDESEEYEQSLVDTGMRYLRYAEELAAAKKAQISTYLLRGSVAGEIVKKAEDLEADCIVVGGWEHESSFRDVIQEANREIARASPCSILVTKNQVAERLYKSL
jgi:nucleotide-binding universal stress UspA family protein